MGGKLGNAARAGGLADEEGVGAEVGEGVANEDERGDEGKVTEVVQAELAGGNGCEEDGEGLRGEAG